MRIKEYLRSKGVVFTEVVRPSGTFYITRCPLCGEEDFAINADYGSFNCFHLAKCGIKGNFTKLRELYGDSIVMKVYHHTYSEVTTTIDKPDAKVGQFLTERGFKRDVYKQFQDILGRKENNICFLYKQDGKLMSVKYRDMDTKKFYREKNTPPLLYNMDRCKEMDELFIVEGELDVIAAKHYGIDAVSVPQGAQDESWIEYNWDYLKKFQRIIFMYDNDEAGQKNIQRIAKRLGLSRCVNVLLPYKDVNECLLKGVTQEEFVKCVISAKEFGSDYVVPCTYFTDVMKQKVLLGSGKPTAFEGLTTILKGWRLGELTVWTGINGSGKSNLLLQIATDLCKKGERVLIGSFEIPPARYLRWVVQMDTGEYDAFNDEALSYYDEYLYCINRVGSIKASEIYESIEYAAKRYDVKHIIVDSLMRISYRTSDMYKEQADFVVELCRLAQEYELHIHLVAHPRKGDNDKDEPDKVDVAGSYDITNNAHNVIVVHRIDNEPKLMKKYKLHGLCNTVLIVKKNREYGTHGICPLLFNEKYKKFVDAL